MTEYKTDKHIPFPGTVRPRYDRPGRRDKYPWLDMEVGDSFLFPDHFYEGSAAATVHMANQRFERAYRTGKLPDRKRFQTKRTAEGHRVWRVE